MKMCSNKSCKQLNPQTTDSFYKHADGVNGLRPTCISCCNLVSKLNYENDKESYKMRLKKRTPQSLKNTQLKSAFGIDLSHFYLMIMDQSNCCAICDKPETALTPSGELLYLSVDHCHETDVVRGLLCNKCNRGLGHFDDKAKTIQLAADYLKKHEKGNVFNGSL
jgi:Recombination endonuclease VII